MERNAKTLLIMRFSALGDVLMTIPVIDALARQYPDVSIWVASRPQLESLFRLLPPNVHFMGVELKSFRQRNTFLWLFRRLHALKPTAVCDLHNVIRTRVMDTLFSLFGTKVAVLDKDRAGRRRFIEERPVKQRKTTFQRYLDTLEELGYHVNLDPSFTLVQGKNERKGIGIAPFAAHQGKIYPLDRMEKLAGMLPSPVYLFGAGEKERAILQTWEEKYPGVHNMAGKLPDLAEEVRFMSSLKAMVSMDSANMHLSSLAGTRVISIWGATHPCAGFLGWGQRMEDCVQAEMECRPCSIYGARPCAKGDYPCLGAISVETLLDIVGKL